MTAYLTGTLVVISALGLGRLLPLCLALFAHHRWRIPIADLERLIRTCYPARAIGRRRRSPDADE